MEIPFSMAILGGNIDVPTVDGSVKIKVRSGTQSGTMVRLRGKGIAAIHSRGKGDEYVRLTITTPERLTHEQRDLVNDLKREGL
jgi:DnaJ-class molecular chaperone